MDYLFAKIMLRGKERGDRAVSLGKAPLSRVGGNACARANERLAALVFQYGGRLCKYRDLRRYPDTFAQQRVGAYLAYRCGKCVRGLLIDVADRVDGGYRRFLFGGRR